MKQNIEWQTGIQFVETTPNIETQLQQQSNFQQTYQEQNYPPSPPQNVADPENNVNPQQYELRPTPTRNVKEFIYFNFVEQESLCNSSRQAIMLYCPYCQTSGMTKITYTMGEQSWCLVLILCIMTLVCFWIPFICNDCQNVNHFCSNCGRQVGEVKYGKQQKSQQQNQGQTNKRGKKQGTTALGVLLRKI